MFVHGQDSKLEVLEMDPQLGLAIGLTEGQKVHSLMTTWRIKIRTTNANGVGIGQCRLLPERT